MLCGLGENYIKQKINSKTKALLLIQYLGDSFGSLSSGIVSTLGSPPHSNQAKSGAHLLKSLPCFPQFECPCLANRWHNPAWSSEGVLSLYRCHHITLNQGPPSGDASYGRAATMLPHYCSLTQLPGSLIQTQSATVIGLDNTRSKTALGQEGVTTDYKGCSKNRFRLLGGEFVTEPFFITL